MLCHSKDGTETSQDRLFYTITISALLVPSTPESDYCFNQKRSDPLFWNISNQFRQKKTLKKSFNIIWTPLMVFGKFYQYIVN